MRRQLNALVAMTTSLVLIALLVPVGIVLYVQAKDQAIAEAAYQARTAAAEASTYDGPPERFKPFWNVHVFFPDGSKTLGAVTTPSVRLAKSGKAFAVELDSRIEVFTPVEWEGEGTLVVQHQLPYETIYLDANRAIAVLTAISALLVLLGVLMADRIARIIVRATVDLAKAADSLAEGDLSARVEPGGTKELRRVGREFNRLAERIGTLLEAQREETADLAHQLRTPLTALRLNADGTDDPDLAARLRASIGVLNTYIDEMIRSARRPDREGALPSADLVSVAADRFEFWKPLAEDSGRRFTLRAPMGPLPIATSREDIGAAVDTLLDNAFSHTPDGTAIELTVTEEGEFVADDAGPGFSELEAVRGRSSGGSTGLGLDIARRTVESTGGELRIERSPSGGARVVLAFGSAG
ncbi:ATP-binding protein [Salininema proteolyticum]|uniref:histidine kinase n=1 Tax=Salininema proteolyticum TaxID=1607685 RepID=A0ABV8TXX0_9ACTN